jgi:hypothetical protein
LNGIIVFPGKLTGKKFGFVTADLLGKNFFHDPTFFDTGEALVEPFEGIAETIMVNPHQVQNGRIQVADMDRVFQNVVTEFICFAVHNSTLHATTCHPDRKAFWVMIASIVGFAQWALAIDGSSKFAPPYYECVIQHPTLSEIS